MMCEPLFLQVALPHQPGQVQEQSLEITNTAKGQGVCMKTSHSCSPMSVH